MLSEVELQRIFDVRKQWANSSFACICKEKYGSIHETIRLLIVWKSSTYPQPRPGSLGRGFVLHFHTCSARTARFSLLYRNTILYYFLFCAMPVGVSWTLRLLENNYIILFRKRKHTIIINKYRSVGCSVKLKFIPFLHCFVCHLVPWYCV